MKQSRKMDQKQAHLFPKSRLSDSRNFLELAADRKAELEEALGALLLQTARKQGENLAGKDDDDHDE